MTDGATLLSWLNGLQGGAATFIGALTGSVVGFAALVAGALFNAKLNRDRDERLRRIEARSIAAALRAELESLRSTLMHNAESLGKNPPNEAESFFIPDLSHSVRMFPKLADKMGLLNDPAIIMEITQAYIVIDQYCENLLMMGGQLGEKLPTHRRLILMPSGRAKSVASMNTKIAERIETARNMLDKYLD